MLKNHAAPKRFSVNTFAPITNKKVPATVMEAANVLIAAATTILLLVLSGPALAGGAASIAPQSNTLDTQVVPREAAVTPCPQLISPDPVMTGARPSESQAPWPTVFRNLQKAVSAGDAFTVYIRHPLASHNGHVGILYSYSFNRMNYNQAAEKMSDGNHHINWSQFEARQNESDTLSSLLARYELGLIGERVFLTNLLHGSKKQLREIAVRENLEVYQLLSQIRYSFWKGADAQQAAAAPAP
jgi:hypothetical protein